MFARLMISSSLFFSLFFLLTHTTTKVHEHGLMVVAPEQLSLLDESVQSKKMKNKSGSTSPALNTRKFVGSPASVNSPTGRYDYSIVQHLDSTDI
jgi:hypothetical protein